MCFCDLCHSADVAQDGLGIAAAALSSSIQNLNCFLESHFYFPTISLLPYWQSRYFIIPRMLSCNWSCQGQVLQCMLVTTWTKCKRITSTSSLGCINRENYTSKMKSSICMGLYLQSMANFAHSRATLTQVDTISAIFFFTVQGCT